jgi:16S rRNA (adenine1518-N6/adenine1519-N6)-dimethyltransferase
LNSNQPEILAPAQPAFRPSKRFGQNFLHDRSVIQRIITALDPRAEETIIEIGPGQGALTSSLLQRAGSVIAIEFDKNLIPILAENFKTQTNFRLIENDALTVDFCEAIQPATTARLVANLPYNVATAIVQRLIEQRRCTSEMVLMLQKEVVERMTAEPGSGERGYFSVFVQTYCETEKLFDVAPGSFRPAPKVWSSVVRLRARSVPAIQIKNEKLLWQVVSAGFGQRRKTILNNLRNAPEPLSDVIKNHGGASIILCQADVGLQRRAETLTLAEWNRIVHALC